MIFFYPSTLTLIYNEFKQMSRKVETTSVSKTSVTRCPVAQVSGNETMLP